VSRKFVRRGFKLGAIVGAGFFLAQVFLRKQAPSRGDDSTRTVPPPKLSHVTPETSGGAAAPLNNNGATLETEAPSKVEAPASTPAARPAKAKPAPKAAGAGTGAGTGSDEVPPWVDPENGECPPSHPIKAKLSSKIFHAPGGLAYDRTTPDRCYRDAATAEADGFRPSKR